MFLNIGLLCPVWAIQNYERVETSGLYIFKYLFAFATGNVTKISSPWCYLVLNSQNGHVTHVSLATE